MMVLLLFAVLLVLLYNFPLHHATKKSPSSPAPPCGEGAGGVPAGEMSRRGKITKRRPVKIGGSVQSVKSKTSYKIYQKPLHCAGVFGIIIRRLRMPCIFAGQRYALTREVAALCVGFSAEYVRSMNRAKEY